jgi:hypothetical protein
MNSIDKDPKGNYIVSSRFLHTVTYISGETGEIIWVLGGKRNNFKDLSDGAATGFMYQHDARWQDDYTTITLFDNGAEDGHWVEPYTRGMRIKIDQEAMTAELVNEYVNPNHIFAISQGSLQVLPNSNVLMGYGNTGAMTEYAANGTVLCDVHFGPQAWFGAGDIQSYRTYKFDWVGRPDTKPDVQILPSEDGSNLTSLYVSWNGDTEVRRWILQATNDVEDERWKVIDDEERDGFETQLTIKSDAPHYVRVKGVDGNGKYLVESDPWNWRQEKVCFIPRTKNLGLDCGLMILQMWSSPPLKMETEENFPLKFLMGCIGFTGVIVCLREFWVERSRISRRTPGFHLLQNYHW